MNRIIIALFCITLNTMPLMGQEGTELISTQPTVTSKTDRGWKFIKENSLDVAAVTVTCAGVALLVASAANYIVMRKYARFIIDKLANGRAMPKGDLDKANFILESSLKRLAYYNFTPISVFVSCASMVALNKYANSHPIVVVDEMNQKLDISSQEVCNV